MKTTSFVLPVVALLIVGGWIGIQRRSITTLDKESALLQTRLVNARESADSELSSQGKNPDDKTAKDKVPIDWKQAAVELVEMQGHNGTGDMRAMIHLHQRVQSMTREELVAALYEIAKLDLPAVGREKLEQMLLGPLMEKDPELALRSFSDLLKEQRGDIVWSLSIALGQWAEKDPANAAAWFDEQIAAGKFDSKTLDGKSPARILFEGEMIRTLVGSDRAAAEARLAKLPEDQRMGIFRGSSASKVKEPDQKAFADLARGRLPEEDKNSAIALIATNVSPNSYAEATAYLDRIAATPEERTLSAKTVAKFKLMQVANQGVITREDIDKMREWVTTQSPGTADAATGNVLAGAASIRNGKLDFSDAAALALQYHESSGNDDVLIGFLNGLLTSGRDTRSHNDEARVLAGKISDPKRRDEILGLFK